MKICILKESLNIGGTERSAANISKVLSINHDVSLVLYDAGKLNYQYGGHLVDLQCPSSTNLIKKIINNIIRFIKLKRFIKKKEIDLLYEFIAISNPLIFAKHKSLVKIISARDFGRLRTYSDLYIKALNSSDAVICNSHYLQESFSKLTPIQKDKIFTVYNIIDFAEINKSKYEDVESDFNAFLSRHSFTLVAVGRFCKEKGFEYLIESFSLVRNVKKEIGLVLVGDGTYLNRYESIINNLQVKDHVYLTGFQTNPYKYMHKCNCFVLSSISEGFPNVLAEAMALGLPVIAANCLTGPAEILRKDMNYDAVSNHYELCDYGILTPCVDEKNRSISITEMAHAIIALLNDSILMQKYSSLSKERAYDFSAKVATSKLNQIFKELLIRKKN